MMKCALSLQFLVLLVVTQNAFSANIQRYSVAHAGTFSFSLNSVQSITALFKYTSETVNENPEPKSEVSLQQWMFSPYVLSNAWNNVQQRPQQVGFGVPFGGAEDDNQSELLNLEKILDVMEPQDDILIGNDLVYSSDVMESLDDDDINIRNDLNVMEPQDDVIIGNDLNVMEPQDDVIIGNDLNIMKPQVDAIIGNDLIPLGYENINNIGYYKYHTDFLTWFDAEDRCLKEGAHLIVIDSEDEMIVVKTLFTRHRHLVDRSYFVFIGYNDFENEGEYVSVVDDSILDADYISWTKNSHGSTSDNCMGATIYGEVNDINCITHRNFICELIPQ